jgi:hypothetical protein
VPTPTGPTGTGGIFNESSASLQIGNSIVALNAYGPTYAQADCMGTILSAGYNLFGSLTDCSLGGDTTGNFVGVDPMLPALPTVDPVGTWSYPPLEGSPVIDTGNPALVGSSETACETVDQRGVSRPIGSVCDIGAYESEFGTVGTPSGRQRLCTPPTANRQCHRSPGDPGCRRGPDADRARTNAPRSVNPTPTMDPQRRQHRHRPPFQLRPLSSTGFRSGDLC